jgi:mRNA interferase MazF
VKRGEIWWIAFPAPVGRRPAVLISRDQAYRVRTAITVVPLTQTIRNIASEVPLGPSDGVPRRSRSAERRCPYWSARPVPPAR